MESLQKSDQIQAVALKTKCRTSLATITTDERAILKSVNSIDNTLAVRSELASITSLRVENPNLATAFIASNMVYLCSVIGIELSKAQEIDMIDEVGQVGWLTMADFKLILDRAKRHKFFHKDYQEFLQLFWDYVDERLERAFSIESSKVDTIDNTPRVAETLQLKHLTSENIKQQ